MGLHKRRMKEALSARDCLYTVVERTADRETARVIGSMCVCRYVYAPEEERQVIAALDDERTRIVSLTIAGDGQFSPPGPIWPKPSTGAAVAVDRRERRLSGDDGGHDHADHNPARPQ